jgi:transposase
VQHVAIDLGGRESQICIRDDEGTILNEARVATCQLGKIAATWPASRVVLETSAEAFAVADAMLAVGHQVRVVPGTLVRSLGVGARRMKTDRRDAQVLSEVSCRIDLPSVHIPSATSRELKSLCGAREALLEMRTKLINNVRGWLRTQLWRVRTGATYTFPHRVREHSDRVAVPLPEHVERQLVVIETVTVQLQAADRQLGQIANRDPVCRRLMTVPGVGPVTAVRFVAAIDDPSRFRTAHHVESYLGLTPGENSSSDRQQRTGITKAGPKPLRRTLIQAAWTAFRQPSDAPMVAWARRIAARRGKFIAVVALARKIAGILFALWRDGTIYDPAWAAAVSPPEPVSLATVQLRRAPRAAAR